MTRYDVVVLDRDLPGIHGDEVCWRIVAGGASSRMLKVRRATEYAPMVITECGAAELAILDADGHLLIQGGPGSGKTTIALLKAARTLERLEPEQQVVFLWTSSARTGCC